MKMPKSLQKNNVCVRDTARQTPIFDKGRGFSCSASESAVLLRTYSTLLTTDIAIQVERSFVRTKQVVQHEV